MTDYTAGIQQLQRIFGNQLDKDTLTAVLEVCGGDAKEAAKYLQAADNSSGYDPRQLNSIEGGIPKDYPLSQKGAQPKNFAPYYQQQKQSEVKKETPIEEEIKSLFLSENVSLQIHFDTQKQNYNLYVSVLCLLLEQQVEISKASRVRILAAAWARQDKALPKYLLQKEEMFGLPQVLGALGLLDAGRKVRALEKKIARLEKQGTVKPKKLGLLKAGINDWKREAHIGSVSGALAKEIKLWVRKIPAEKLEFYALNLPKAPWCELADIVHLNPADFQCPWFLNYVFGKDAPEDSMLTACKNLSPETLTGVLAKWPVPYSWLRLNVKPIPEDAKVIIAKYSPLNIVVWYHEELCNADVDKVIDQKIDSEKLTFGYGKLMERLLYFKSINAPFFKKLMPLAEQRLKSINLELESPVVVIGDASYSMDVAIRVSTVIASILTALCGAELKFFTGDCVDPPVIPRDIPQVLDVATGVKADGLTAPAAALWPYYTQKKVVKFFVVVTDEVENEKYQGTYFPSLFQKYCKEIYPSKIVFVSFLENPSEKGRMVTALENMGIVPLQFKLDGKRPDLTKLDSLLGLLASESSFFPKQVQAAASRFKDNNFGTILHQQGGEEEEDKGGKEEEKL